MKLIEYFIKNENVAKTHSWDNLLYNSKTASTQDLADVLADMIAKHICRGSVHHYEAWKQKKEEGTPLPASSKKALHEAFIGPIFGVPEDPDAIDPEHVEGYVSQMLWYFLYSESPPEEIVRLEPPGFKSTDPGGDALAIHRVGDGYLMFRLWEIKKYTGSSQSSTNVNSTVYKAYRQLRNKALEYLARYTVIGQEIPDPDLSSFYGQLVDIWLEARKEAAAGISVVTSQTHVPKQCFVTFGKHFPEFTEPVRLRGILMAVEDFSTFVEKVRDSIWQGL